MLLSGCQGISAEMEAGILECFTVADPTRILPDDIGFRMTQAGVEVVAAVNRNTVLFTWPWHAIFSISGQHSADPTDMDTFSLSVQGVGEFMFECDDCSVTQGIFERCKESARLEGLEKQLSSMRASTVELHTGKLQAEEELAQLRQEVSKF